MKETRFWRWAGLLAIVAIGARLIPGPRTIDDAYITFRFASNILAGNGFVYNLGEQVLGTSTPLYALVMALLGSLLGEQQADFPRLAWQLNALLDGGSVAGLAMLGRRLGLRWAGWGSGLAWALAPFSVSFAIGGLETSLYVLLLTGLALSYVERRYVLSALLASLAVMTRPDALLLVVPIAAHRLLASHRVDGARITRKEWAAFLLPYRAWALFAILYFGSPLPHSVLAKSAAYQLNTSTALIRLLQHYATPFQAHLLLGTAWIGVGLFLFPFFYLVGARELVGKESRVFPMAAYPWIYFLVYALANPLIFRWYLTPPLPFLFLFILAGLEQLMFRVVERLNWNDRMEMIGGLALIVAAPSMLLLNAWTASADHGPGQPAPEMAWIKLELLYEEAAKYLVNLPDWSAESTVAGGDVGVLGYRTGAQILDLVGLNSVVSVGYFPLPAAAYKDFVFAIPSDLVLDELPDYIVSLEIYGRHTLLKDAEFLERFELIHELPNDIYGSRNMLIYQLAD